MVRGSRNCRHHLYLCGNVRHQQRIHIMLVLESFDALKDTTGGIILLSAPGSLAATGIAFSASLISKRFTRRVKATQWDFGWWSAYCDGDLLNMPVFVNFLIALLSKTILVCTITIAMLLISTFWFFVSRDLLSYGLSIVPLSISLYSFITAYSDYKSLKLNTKWWIAQRNKEHQKNAASSSSTKPQTSTTGRTRVAKSRSG
jgi:hypothetical protein